MIVWREDSTDIVYTVQIERIYPEFQARIDCGYFAANKTETKMLTNQSTYTILCKLINQQITGGAIC